MPPSSRSPQPIKAVLALSDTTIADLARETECSRQWVGRVVNGRERPSVELAQRCSDVLGVPVGQLFVTDAEDVVVALVRKSCLASGVPERLEDAAAVEHIAFILGGVS